MFFLSSFRRSSIEQPHLLVAPIVAESIVHSEIQEVLAVIKPVIKNITPIKMPIRVFLI
jgi:hypothetical protein